MNATTSDYFSFDNALKKSHSCISLGYNQADLVDVKNETQTKYLLTTVYATNKKYARWFDVSETKTHDSGGYTIYKIVYRLIPNDLHESIKELFVWKRFREIKELYEVLSVYHASLHRRGKFPDFVQTSFFGRFSQEIINKRKKCILNMLKFCSNESHLINHLKFIDFFADGVIKDFKMEDKSLLEPQLLVDNLFDSKIVFKKSDDTISLAHQQALLEDALRDLDTSQHIDNNLHDLNHGNKYIYLKVVNNCCLLIKSKNEQELFYLKFKRKSDDLYHMKLTKRSFKHMVNLVTYYQNDCSLYLILEYKKNGKLYDFCKDLGDKLTLDQVKIYLAQVVCALEELHLNGIVCKDLKMDNILVCDDPNQVCLTYFSSQLSRDQEINELAVKQKYTAPEISEFMRNDDVSSMCDVWSFGVIAFELLTKTKFHEINANLHDYLSNIEHAASLIDQLLHPNPTQRLSINQIKRHAFFNTIKWSDIQ